MYYAEQCVNGVWYWRDTPDGEWQKFDYQKLQNKLNAILKWANE